MSAEQRIEGLSLKMKALRSDDIRYAIGEKIRELGYVNFRDFHLSNPSRLEIDMVEKLLELRI